MDKLRNHSGMCTSIGLRAWVAGLHPRKLQTPLQQRLVAAHIGGTVHLAPALAQTENSPIGNSQRRT